MTTKSNEISADSRSLNDSGFFHAVSLSGGKDSSAMLILMIERGMPIDLVLSADTGMEFPEMYLLQTKNNPRCRQRLPS